MKKITFLMGAILSTSTVLIGQTTVQLETEGNFEKVILAENRDAQVACSDQEDSNSFENGFGNMNVGTQVADDFQVPQGETFEPQTLIVNIINDGGFDDINVSLFADNGAGLPGEEIFSDDIDVEEINLIGTAFGRQVFEIEVEFPAGIILEGDNSGETDYWVAVTTPNPLDPNSDAFWETTTNTANTTLSAFRNVADPDFPTDWANSFVNGGGATQDMPPAAVFIIEGNCEALSLEDNALASLSVYPNPTTDVVNLEINNNVAIKSVVVYDILGKQTSARYIANTIDMSNLNNGLYMVEVTTESGESATYKVVKQ